MAGPDCVIGVDYGTLSGRAVVVAVADGAELGSAVHDYAHGVIERELSIKNRLGLHARAAAKFVQTASRYRSEVKIRRNGEEVDGKSILGILLLAASQGTRITLAVSGDDEKDAFAAVEDLIARSFDEEE